MVVLYILVIGALLLQVVLFFNIKKKNKNLKSKSSILEKYNIKTRSDAFKVLSQMGIPKAEKEEIRRFYNTY